MGHHHHHHHHHRHHHETADQSNISGDRSHPRSALEPLQRPNETGIAPPPSRSQWSSGSTSLFARPRSTGRLDLLKKASSLADERAAAGTPFDPLPLAPPAPPKDMRPGETQDEWDARMLGLRYKTTP